MRPASTLTAATALRPTLGLLSVPAVAVGADGLVIGANVAGAAKLPVALPRAAGRVAADIVPELARATRLALAEPGGGAVILVWPDGDGVSAATVEQQRADMLGRLASGISHDLANTLGPIMTLSSMIATEPGVPDDLGESATLLQDDAEHTLRLVRDTLEFARVRPAARSGIALGLPMRECLGLTSNAMVSIQLQTSVSLRRACAPAPAPVPLPCDRARIRANSSRARGGARAHQTDRQRLSRFRRPHSHTWRHAERAGL